MGFSSQSGHLIIRSQTVAGTYQADTNTAGQAIRLRSGTLAPSRDLLIPDPEIGGNRDRSDAYLGAVVWQGDLEFYTRMKEMSILLKGVLGTPSAPVTTTGVTTHTFTPQDTLPIFSLEEKVGNTFEVYRYNDAKINSLHLEAEANGYLMGTVNVLAKQQIGGQTPGTPTTIYDQSPLVVGTNITVTYNAVSLPAKSFSLDISNNIENDDFRLGSFFIGDTTEKRREMSMNVTVRPQDSGLWRQAVYGTAAATAVGGLTTKQQTVITLTTYEDIPAGTPATKYSLAITVPKSIIAPFEVSPSGDDVIEHSFDIQALRPDPSVALATFVLKNDVPVVQ